MSTRTTVTTVTVTTTEVRRPEPAPKPEPPRQERPLDLSGRECTHCFSCGDPLPAWGVFPGTTAGTALCPDCMFA
jgi:hypothetical protein